MLLVAFAQVVCRYVFKYSIVWSDEYCRLAFFVTIFFGSALCFLDRKHIVVDVIYNILPRAAIRYLLLFTNAMCIIFCIFLGMAGYRYAIANAAQLTSCMSIPLLYVYIMMPVACALMIISILRAGYREFFEIYAPQKEKMKRGGSQNDITFGRRFLCFDHCWRSVGIWYRSCRPILLPDSRYSHHDYCTKDLYNK